MARTEKKEKQVLKIYMWIYDDRFKRIPQMQYYNISPLQIKDTFNYTFVVSSNPLEPYWLENISKHSLVYNQNYYKQERLK